MYNRNPFDSGQIRTNVTKAHEIDSHNPYIVTFPFLEDDSLSGFDCKYRNSLWVENSSGSISCIFFHPFLHWVLFRELLLFSQVFCLRMSQNGSGNEAFLQNRGYSGIGRNGHTHCTVKSRFNEYRFNVSRDLRYETL